jgi:hypothetical protein
MADFTITVSNSLAIVGATPSSLWGTMEWGENWGAGSEDFITSVFKFLANTTTLSDSLTKQLIKFILNTQTINGDMTEQQMFNGSGWNYVFVKPSTDAEDRSGTEWTDANTGDVATWTCQAAGSTTWTEL